MGGSTGVNSQSETFAPVLATPKFSRYDDSNNLRHQVNEYSNHNIKTNNKIHNNEVYHLVTQHWPNTKVNYQSNVNSNNRYYVGNNNNNQNFHQHTDSTSGLIALVSFPGSGNTWLRYLLQQATGK